MSQDVKDVEVHGSVEVKSTNPKKLVLNDPVVYIEGAKSTPGKVVKVFEENEVCKVIIEPSLKSKENIVVKANDPNLDPLFFTQSNGNKVHTKFSYNELLSLLKKEKGENKMFNLDWNDLKKNDKSYNNLMLGNQTALFDNIQISNTKVVDGQSVVEKFKKEARLQLRRSVNGTPYVHAEFKHQNLNLDNPYYGLTFTAEQKEQLKTTGDLGLIDGFTNTETGEIYKLWVSVDPVLNKVVSKRENDVYLDKIYGRTITEKEKEIFKKGEGQILEFKKGSGEKYNMFVKISAASTNRNGIRTFSPEKAKEFGLLPDTKKKSKGQKIG